MPRARTASADDAVRTPRRGTGGLPVIAPWPVRAPGAGSSSTSDSQDTDTAMAVGTTVDHLTETYRAHYRSLLGLAALLLDDTAS
ncbi:MAG: SigE family RNA polymerase sigma factor, partial [Actinomycetia bacterium]|nr:SigE family RNA polymerase sigma factor [Actinomycetes bacterium]